MNRIMLVLNFVVTLTKMQQNRIISTLGSDELWKTQNGKRAAIAHIFIGQYAAISTSSQTRTISRVLT